MIKVVSWHSIWMNISQKEALHATNNYCVFFSISKLLHVLCLGGNITYLLHWHPSWPGYDWHLAYTISEWSLMIIFSLAVLTFFFDFKKIQVEEPRLQVTRYSTCLNNNSVINYVRVADNIIFRYNIFWCILILLKWNKN